MEGMKDVLQIHWEDAEHRVPARIGAKQCGRRGSRGDQNELARDMNVNA